MEPANRAKDDFQGSDAARRRPPPKKAARNAIWLGVPDAVCEIWRDLELLRALRAFCRIGNQGFDEF
jgi:hypothetical protein